MTADQAIVRLRKRPNDPEAWEIVYAHMQQRLSAYVSSLLCTFTSPIRESAHDVVHDALCKFWDRWSEIKNGIPDARAAYEYLKKSCRNSLIDKYRHDRNSEPLFDFLTLKFDKIPEDSIVRRLLIREVIRALSGQCGSILQAYVEEGVSLAELADREGTLPAAFYSRWHRCLQKARELVKLERPGERDT